jgi:hypothetical protein
MPEHALLSASGAHKWLHCTPSPRLEEKMPESESNYANEGRLAHEIGELKLRKKFIEPMGERTYKSRLKKLQEKPLYDSEMLTHTDTYLNYISGVAHGFKSPPYVSVEKRIDYSTYAPDGFGTCDCIIIAEQALYIIDFKYGKGVPVSAEDNPQMKLYALGAYTAYMFLYDIQTVKLAIVQPRLNDNPSEYEMPISDLLAWGESIKPIAQKAFNGEGEYVSGEHCRFCRAKALCQARAEFNMGVEELHPMKPPLLSNDDVGRILAKAMNLAKWVKDLEEYALAEILRGNEIPGWKAVEGRSDRKFTSVDDAFAAVKANGYDEALLYERKPITLTKVEELLGKKKFTELLSAHVTKPQGKPTLAQANDKREPINRQITPEQAFGNIEP